MAKTRQQKEKELKSFADKFKNGKSLIFVNFTGLKVKEIEELRRNCRNAGVDYAVVKKRLIGLALKDAGIDFDSKSLENSVAVAIGREDEVVPAKVVYEFAKGHDALKAVGGILEKNFIDKNQVEALAKLPSKDELLAKVVGSINAPVSGFVNVLAGNLRSLLYALNAVKEAKN